MMIHWSTRVISKLSATVLTVYIWMHVRYLVRKPILSEKAKTFPDTIQEQSRFLMVRRSEGKKGSERESKATSRCEKILGTIECTRRCVSEMECDGSDG